MIGRKLLYLALFGIIYCVYTVQLWFLNRYEEVKKEESVTVPGTVLKYPVILAAITKKPKKSPNTCDVTEILIINPFICEKKVKFRPEKMYADSNTITVIGITVLLIVLTLNAILDVVKVKEEERARRKLNPDGERRQSLSEFAKKTSLRRESSKFGQHLYQIAESFVTGSNNSSISSNDSDNKKKRNKLYVRGESINSYLSDKRKIEGSAPASVGDTGEPKLVKRQSVAKLFGMFTISNLNVVTNNQCQ